MKKTLLTLASLVTLATSTKAQFSFIPSSYYSTGNTPYGIATADFNNDGKADLATANFAGSSNNVSILLGNGIGVFAAAVNFGVGTGLNPISLTSADFNNDGNADLAIANYNSANIAVLIGNGAGSFAAAVNYTVGNNPRSISSADFNGDGKADLAVANFQDNNVSILLGSGTGSFGSVVNYGVGTNPTSLTKGDYNSDGKTDLAVANYNGNTVSILLGSATGTFATAANYTVGAGLVSISSADFNGDGNTDLATVSASGSTVYILIGSSTGTFVSTVNYAVGTKPYSVIAADLNGDGKADLASANETSNNVSVLLGSGTGTFAAAVNFVVGTAPVSISSGDFNNDSKPDLATANSDGNDAAVLLSICFPATLTSSQTNICTVSGTGSATITASGSSPYTYTWSPSGGNAPTAISLSAGNYTCEVTNKCGAKASKTINIKQSVTALATSSTAISTLCNGSSNGSATITASGGTSPYSYLWNTTDTISVITGQMASTYTATVTDNIGCTSVKAITIGQPAAIVTSATVSNVLCNGGSTGAATVTPSGGTSPFTYLWNTGATTSVTTGLMIGAYTANVTDNNGCTSVESVNITEPSTILPSFSTIGNSCFGGSTGSATLTPIGGTSPYTYVWSTGATTSFITTQMAGVKTVTLTDANGCTQINTVTITQPATAVASSTSAINILCNGGSTGTGTITASGGTSPYTYLWNTSATTSVITGQMAGVKTVTITDLYSCKKITSLTITQSAAIAISTTVTNVLCNGGSTGAASVTPSGGISPYTYLWNTTATISVITGQVAGVKTVTITDANSCTVTNTLAITQPAPFIISATTNNTLLCVGQTATLTASVGATSYTWNTAATSAVITITPTTNTSYTVTGTNASGCTNTAIITQSVSTCTGIDNVSSNSSNASFIVFPNPTNGIVNIELEMINGNATHIQLINVLGEVLMNETINVQQVTFNISHLSNGVYFLKVSNNGTSKTSRLIKN